MAKDPAFLFYPNDYAGGTMGMTLEEKGGYMELLILQFNKGAFTIDQAKKLLNGSFEKLWPVLTEKFTEKEGKFFNERLEKEKARRQNFIEIQSVRGKKSAEKRWNNNHGYNQDITKEPVSNNKENENRNEIENEIQDKGVRGEKDLTPLEIGNTIEYVDRVKQYKLSELEVLNFWEAFKINEAEPSYSSHGKKIKHFRDWLKNRDHGSKSNLQSNKSYRSRQNGAVADLISELGNTIAGAAKNSSA